eukprot:CAMPEP_0204826472 /NCGR_PEP_ID=MMETSP1346-20131115/4155_1 /ASSEMBLY_ACC=CAM_ASM_000771 /TAXON_ID=215587 /ORGANISM="Aplanochytrium stocchinoi, Strain GSBS06" /LENGTH=359 /DNA_ID=CAMNT_0051954513 /DNA_START=73 /DNA_END=1152 /DNA_ORIENTATION=+
MKNENLQLGVGGLVLVVWRLTVFSMMVTVAMCYVYNPLRKAAKRGEVNFLYFLFIDAERFFGIATTFVTFILGFFNATVFSRWWQLRVLCGTVNGRSVDTACMISAYVVNGRDALQKRKELLRYLALGHALHAMSASDSGLDLEQLVKLGLIDTTKNKSEYEALNIANSPNFNVAYAWFLQKFAQCIEEGNISNKVGNTIMQSAQTNISSIRGAAADVNMYLNTPIPETYVKLLELMVKIYVLLSPFALVPSLLWVAPPAVAVITVFFYGFLQISRAMMNPFKAKNASIANAGHMYDLDQFFAGTREACTAVELLCPPQFYKGDTVFTNSRAHLYFIQKMEMQKRTTANATNNSKLKTK